MTPVHADEVDRAVDTKRSEVPEGLSEKGGEFGGVHLAGSHGEGAMVDHPEPGRVTIDRHVVGRVSEDHRGAFLAISAANAAASQALPHTKRWRPSSHKSPILLIARPAGSSGTRS